MAKKPEKHDYDKILDLWLDATEDVEPEDRPTRSELAKQVAEALDIEEGKAVNRLGSFVAFAIKNEWDLPKLKRAVQGNPIDRTAMEARLKKFWRANPDEEKQEFQKRPRTEETEAEEVVSED